MELVKQILHVFVAHGKLVLLLLDRLLFLVNLIILLSAALEEALLLFVFVMLA